MINLNAIKTLLIWKTLHRMINLIVPRKRLILQTPVSKTVLWELYITYIYVLYIFTPYYSKQQLTMCSILYWYLFQNISFASEIVLVCWKSNLNGFGVGFLNEYKINILAIRPKNIKVSAIISKQGQWIIGIPPLIQNC